eukprot:CAMPEP_0115199242 /NCGR_PEP_ID=MMETSP0270-20121206/16515_1 /TAXON_ID=71861 /ORGANISM="Scrippsiella trochoidea, Strain CCMP3099" /LENGTH=208 /DNA_ID=CAMNT_0002612629 /DNA_START=96 /DNA_END=718 /DNA_ORIENTATION=-
MDIDQWLRVLVLTPAPPSCARTPESRQCCGRSDGQQAKHQGACCEVRLQASSASERDIRRRGALLLEVPEEGRYPVGLVVREATLRSLLPTEARDLCPERKGDLVVFVRPRDVHLPIRGHEHAHVFADCHCHHVFVIRFGGRVDLFVMPDGQLEVVVLASPVHSSIAQQEHAVTFPGGDGHNFLQMQLHWGDDLLNALTKANSALVVA